MRSSRTVTLFAARKATVLIRMCALKVKSLWTISVTVATNAVHPAASRIAAHCHFNATKLAGKTQTVRQRDLIRVLAAAAKAIAVQYRYAMATRSLVTIAIRVMNARVDFAAN